MRTPVGAARFTVLALLTFLVLPILTLGSPSASASTTVTPLASRALGDSVRPGPSAPRGVTVLGSAVLRVSPTTPGPTTAAGRPAPTTVGLAGTTATLASCRVGPCVREYRTAGTPALTNGHWAIEVRLSVTQPPARTGTPSGFAVEIAFHTVARGWVVAWGYFSTGTSRSATAQTIDLNLWFDLGTTVRPALLTLEVTANACTASGSCP